MFTIVSGRAKAPQSTIKRSRGFGLEYQDPFGLKTNCYTVAHARTAIVIIMAIAVRPIKSTINHYLH